MHSNPIKLSALIFLALASIYILFLYISSYFLASCFIYYTYIDIASVSILIVITIRYKIIYKLRL